MFNGIIYNNGIVKNLKKGKNSLILEVKSNIKISKFEIGSSISCNGVCLTLINLKKNMLSFYLSLETLNRSNFQELRIGDVINIEKSLKYGEKISGNYVQGHIDTVGVIENIKILDKSWFVKISIPKAFRKYLIQKATININGVSLTISKVFEKGFEISIIPHSLKLTNLSKLKLNDKINIEIDIFSKYLFKLNK
jgi:riboflavin synthase|tara:strand:+ start:89 stop:673 length:585 start_codon:yes stop_codon:yes gene_type:complete